MLQIIIAENQNVNEKQKEICVMIIFVPYHFVKINMNAYFLIIHSNLGLNHILLFFFLFWHHSYSWLTFSSPIHLLRVFLQ